MDGLEDGLLDSGTQKARTRERIIEAAARAMRAGGQEGVGVAAVMKQAGLTHGGFYAHFENRDDLVAHAVDRMFVDSARLFERHVEADAQGRLRALIDDYLSEAMLHAQGEGCPLPGLSGGAPSMAEAARRRFGAGIGAFRARLEAMLTAAGVADAGSVADSVLSEMVGAMALARAVEDPGEARRILGASRGQIKGRVGVGGK